MNVGRRLGVLTGSVLLLMGGAWGAAPRAFAHAELLSAEPAPGSRLGTGPGAVTLTFSEAVDPAQSSATVTAPDGATFTGTVSGTRITIPLATNAPGFYRVDWKVVDPQDGHTTTGSYRFAVGTVSGPGSATTQGSGLQGSNLLFATGRAVEAVALLLAAGLLLLAAMGRRRGLAWVRSAIPMRLRLAVLVAFGSGLAVVLGEIHQAQGSLSASAIGNYLGRGLPGGARMARLSFEGLAVTAVAGPFLLVTAVLVAGGLVAVAASGHAAAVHPTWAGITVDSLHLLAGGLWVGGILALATVRPPGGWRGEEGRGLLKSFTPVALSAFATTALFGVIQAFQELRAFSQLWGTSYGRVLLVKIGVIGTMIPLSFIAWRRRLFRRTEGVLAVGVVVVAALLSVLPVPKTIVQPSSAIGAAALPSTGDLTLGSHAGQYLLGLTLRPGRPGRNQLLLYILPVEGSASRAKVRLSMDRQAIPLTVCAPRCRSGTVHLKGGEHIEVAVDGTEGGTTSLTVPRLPAPDGTALLGRVQRRMHELHTFRQVETLTSGLGARVVSDYAFQAPNRLSIAVHENGVSRTVIIGGTTYTRDPGDAWRTERGGPSTAVPSFIWDYFKPFVDPHVIGEDRVDGMRTRILAFFGSSGGTPVWFRLWVDPQGIVRQAQMRAEGHFMDHRYFDFDAPFTIQPPVP